ncbi:uncharacterized protein LOC144469405 [Augochlora pura]
MNRLLNEYGLTDDASDIWRFIAAAPFCDHRLQSRTNHRAPSVVSVFAVDPARFLLLSTNQRKQLEPPRGPTESDRRTRRVPAVSDLRILSVRFGAIRHWNLNPLAGRSATDTDSEERKMVTECDSFVLS